MVFSIGSRGSHIPAMTPRRKRLGVIAGMWDPLDPIETTMTLIAVNISLMLPSPELRRRNIDRYHTFFHANKWQTELAILSLQTCMLTVLARALAFYCVHSTMDTRCTAAHSTMDTHCTAHNLKEIPAEKIQSFVNFCELCRSRARQWVAIQYNRWRLCCREHHGMFPVSWGLKWYFGKNISPSTSSRDL